MWYRFLSLLIVLATLALVTPSYAADNNDANGDISPAAARALASHDYEQVALALFRRKHLLTSPPSLPNSNASVPKK
jgi:hypothetical protein